MMQTFIKNSKSIDFHIGDLSREEMYFLGIHCKFSNPGQIEPQKMIKFQRTLV